MTKDTGEEETEDEVSAEPSEDKKSEEGGDVKVPEEFQKEAMALVESCKTVACLDFLSNEVQEMRSKLMSSQKKNKLNTDDFSSENMPSEY